MSNQAKFLISLLFIVAIILCAGLTRFYLDATKNTGVIDDDGKVVSLVKEYDNGMRVFESESGYYGLLDAEGAVIIEPEWMEILTVTEDMALVSKRMLDEVLIGGVDFEENIVFPFVFRSMQKINDTYYIGTIAEDDSCIVYNTSFVPMFYHSWERAEYDKGILLLEKEQCRFSYYIAEEEPIFRKAQMQCMIADIPLEWNVSNRIYLTELTPEELLRINDIVTSYIDMLMRNDFTQLPSISSAEYISGLSKTDCFAGMQFETVTDFSFSSVDREKKLYDFAFTIEYAAEPSATEPTPTETATDPTIPMGEMEKSVEVHLFFRRNAANQFVLTSMDLDYRSVQIPLQNANPS